MMLRYVIAIKTVLVGAFHEPQALLVEFGKAELVAIDPVENAKFHRHHRLRVRQYIFRLGNLLNPIRVVKSRSLYLEQ